MTEQDIELAKQAGFVLFDDYTDGLKKTIELFAAAIRADEREKVMSEPLTKAMWDKYEAEIRADEREACAKVCDEVAETHGDADECATEIRARGNT